MPLEGCLMVVIPLPDSFSTPADLIFHLLGQLLNPPIVNDFRSFGFPLQISWKLFREV